ncbi:MAG: hypothetical protein GF419_06745 [Ignavibacteriales bacterium]|nr:hypothetical protein [Ignavibacteriales bacterium]
MNVPRTPVFYAAAVAALAFLFVAFEAVFVASEPLVDNCVVEAYVVERSSAGVAARVGPDESDDAAFFLPTMTTLTIVESRDGWARIGRATTPDGSTRRSENALWIPADALGVSVAAKDSERVPLYDAPRPNAVATDSLPAQVEARVIDARDAWVKVTRAGVVGWLPPDAHSADPFSPAP